ncbi:MAG: hypothetical protein R8G66_05685 [Cytophagales bacterium]|nr:hypothetical protein [Cytophagales bacterium]
MIETIAISRQTPAIRSMDFQYLKAEGIRRIQELSGKIWTDYNVHDPGVMLLEVLCYALTDLGYRTSFDMKDLLASNPNDNINDGYQFFTAREILHNNALTILDYRKLIMDVSVLADESNENSEIIGIKNAWLTVADRAEYDVFVHRDKNLLAYVPPKLGDQNPLEIKALYNVVLEFSDSQVFGDLNVDYLEDTVQAFHPNVVALIQGNPVDKPLVGMAPHDRAFYQRLEGMSAEDFDQVVAQTRVLLNLTFRVKVQFPRWDEVDLKWTDIREVKKSIQSIVLTYLFLPDELGITHKLDEDHNILLASIHEDFKSRPVPFIDEITTRLNYEVLGYATSMLVTYQTKVFKILEILAKVKSRLHAHRNLCEDFLSYKALKIEEILLCADIELSVSANVERVQAEIYFLLDRFLSPTVNFYSLPEILIRDSEEKKYQVININRDKNILTVSSLIRQELNAGDIISLSGFAQEVLEVTLVSAEINPFQSTYTDLKVEESVLSLIDSDRGYLFIGKLSEEENRLTEQVFEGPALENGFIDNEELKIADRKRFIHASDIINLIMDVEGVEAVKKLQIANFPQDENPDILAKSVRWCLEMAIDQDYVPRLSPGRSKLTFYKNELPFQANSLEVERLFEEKKANQRPQKTADPILDFDVPAGECRELSDYVSVQDDLPITHGVGPAGVPLDYLDDDAAKLRTAHARQLKGFLMIFDQLLANYLSQLDHVKDLFSFNPKRKLKVADEDFHQNYDFQVDKTYYSQPLIDVVDAAIDLYVDFDGFNPTDDEAARELKKAAFKAEHLEVLQSLTETEDTFSQRRNKFLDHLMGRFAEQFTDYALLAYKLDGPKTDLELIEDKQDFLNIYPEISANRGKAFNYINPLLWHLDNVSGLVKRVNFISGIDPAELVDLQFDPDHIHITGTEGDFGFEILYEGNPLLFSSTTYTTMKELKSVVEKVILYGLCEDNYQITCRQELGDHLLSIKLFMGTEVVAAIEDNFTTEEDARTALNNLIGVFRTEFLDNPLSNRNNFSLPFDPYFDTYFEAGDIDLTNNTFKIRFKLFASPFQKTDDQVLLSGVLEGEIEVKDQDSEEEAKIAAEQKVREIFWQIVFFGEDDCQYILREYGLAIIDTRLGEDIAAGDVAQINTLLEGSIVLKEGLSDFEQAVAHLSAFFGRNFHRQEGLHLVEHILLRPKINGLWVPIINRPDILTLVPETDTFIPLESELTQLAKVSGSEIVIADGDFRDDLRFNLTLTIHFGGETYGCKVLNYAYDNATNETHVIARENIATELNGRSDLTITYERLVRVVAIEEETFELTLKAGTDFSKLDLHGPEGEEPWSEIQLVSATQETSYGFFRVASVDEATRKMKLDQMMVQDKLLPIYLPTIDNDIEGGEDCDACKVDNPYTYIAQVVVPAWPGRFDNIDFRRFFEKTIRMEAPAHVFLNICWIGYDQMEVFERNMKTWLLENKYEFPVRPYSEAEVAQITDLSKAHRDLVDIMYQFRNIYPVKTLHDCDESQTTEGAIILNKTALGEI